MKRLSFFVAVVLSFWTFAADIEEKVLFSFKGLAVGTKIQGMPNELVAAPGAHGGQVLKVSYPKYEKTGDPEWPSVYFRAPVFSGVDLAGWDALVVTVYNPLPERVDLGISLNGQKHFGKHVMLQPNAWNHYMVPVSEFRELIGARLVNFDFFMTRPEKNYDLYYDDIKLVKRNPPAATQISMDYMLADFEGRTLPPCFELNDVEATLTTEWSQDGRQAVRLKYPVYKDGRAPWPSFQLWTAYGNSIGYDWSAFAAFSLATYYKGSGVLPIKLYIADANGKTYSQEFLLNPGTENTLLLDLRKVGVDIRCVQQVDLFLSRPEAACEILVDSVRLHTPRMADLSDMKAEIEGIKAKFNAIAPERRGNIMAEFNQLTARIAVGFEAASAKVITLGQLRQLTETISELRSWTNGRSRLLDEEFLYAETLKHYPASPFGIGVADSMTKVMIQDLPLKDVTCATAVDLELAKNEYESFQMVAVGIKDAEASVEVGELKQGDSVLPASAVSVSLVGHVKCEKPPYAASYQGWWPDPLLDFQQSAPVKAHEAVSFWVRFKMPETAQAGFYTGKVMVKANGEVVAAIPLRVRVYDFVVPEKSPLDNAWDFRDHIRQIYGKDISEERYQQLLNQMADTLAAYKIDFNRIYRGLSEKGNPASLGLPIDILKRQRDQGILRRFCIMLVDTPRKCTDVNDPHVQAAIDRALGILDYWVPILKREGLLDYAYIYGYDEYPANTFPVIAKVFKGIKAHYPTIPIATTAYDHSFGMATCLGDAVDIFTPLTPRYNPEAVAASRKAGHKIWWYICIGPPNPHANWFIEYAAIEARLLMGAMTAKYRPDGFLYYATTRWPLNDRPIDGGPYTNWNPASFRTANGDGSIFCAGPNGLLGTIRSENYRDGLEDYAYVLELEKRLGGTLPKKYEIPVELVTNLTMYSRDPKVLRAYRRMIAEAIEAVK